MRSECGSCNRYRCVSEPSSLTHTPVGRERVRKLLDSMRSFFSPGNVGFSYAFVFCTAQNRCRLFTLVWPQPRLYFMDKPTRTTIWGSVSAVWLKTVQKFHPIQKKTTTVFAFIFTLYIFLYSYIVFCIRCSEGEFVTIKKERLRRHHVDLYEVLFQHKLCCKMAVSLGIKRRNTKWKKITDSSRIICLNPYSV